MLLGAGGLIAYFSAETGEQFEMLGQPIGWTSKYKELKADNALKIDEIRTLTAKLESADVELKSLKAQNSKMLIEKEQQEIHRKSPWFPVDKVHFSANGNFTTRSREGNGRWSDPESEIKLTLLSTEYGSATFSTNLREPYNRLSFNTSKMTFGWIATKFEYLLTAYDMHGSSATVSIERRERMAE